MKKFWIFCALVFAGFTGYGQTTLAAGDVAFIGYNALGSNSGAPNFLAFICRKPIDVGTVLYISNQNWNGTSFDSPISGGKQGTIKLTFNEPISIGQTVEIVFSTSSSYLKSSVGQVAYTAGNSFDFDPASNYNEVYAFQSSTGLTFITGLVWDNKAPTTVPSGLVFTSGSSRNAFFNGINGNSTKCAIWRPSSPTATIDFNGTLNNTFYSSFSNWEQVNSNSISNGYCPCNPDSIHANITNNLYTIISEQIVFSKYLYNNAGNWKQWNGTAWDPLVGGPDWGLVSGNSNSRTREIIIHKSLAIGDGSTYTTDLFECAKLTVEDSASSGGGSGNSGVTLTVLPGSALKIHYALSFIDQNGSSKPSIQLKSAHSAGTTHYASIDPTTATLNDPDGDFIYDLHIQYPGWHHLQSPISSTFANIGVTPPSGAGKTTFAFTPGAPGTGNTFSWDASTSQWSAIANTSDNFSSVPYTILFQESEVPCVLTVTGTLSNPDQDAVTNLAAAYHDPNLSGNVSYGNVPGWYGDGDDGWNFYGNPYLTPISTEDLLSIFEGSGNSTNKMSGLANKVYVWQPGNTITNLSSDYRTKSYLSSVHAGDATAQYLPPFQAFFMRRPNGNANTQGFPKSKKYRKTVALTSSNSIVNKTASATEQYELRLKRLSTSETGVIYAAPLGKNRFVDLTGDVLASIKETTFGMAYDSMLFVIKFWPISQEDTSSIDVLVSHPVQGESFVLSSPNSDAYILDKAMGTLHSFQQGDYSFSHDSAYNASARFQWIFAPNATVGIEETLLPPVPLKVKVDAFQVEFEYPEDVAIHILDLQGREVMKGAIINGSFIWETSNQAPGAYIITSELFSEKFILP